MKLKIIISFLTAVVLAYFFRSVIGSWLASNYAYSSSFLGPENPENFDGFVHSYIFFSALFISTVAKKIKIGFYFSLPVVLLIVFVGGYNPHLWLSFLLLALGLSLAWLILKLKARFFRK